MKNVAFDNYNGVQMIQNVNIIFVMLLNMQNTRDFIKIFR